MKFLIALPSVGALAQDRDASFEYASECAAELNRREEEEEEEDRLLSRGIIVLAVGW